MRICFLHTQKQFELQDVNSEMPEKKFQHHEDKRTVEFDEYFYSAYICVRMGISGNEMRKISESAWNLHCKQPLRSMLNLFSLTKIKINK